MTMSVARWSAAVALFALLLSPGPAHAGTIALRLVRAIYVDAKEGPLKRPEGVACAAQGETTQVVVADTGNRRLVRYTVARDATVGAAVETKLEQLPTPVRVQLDSKGNALVLDGKTRRLVRVGVGGEFRGFLEVKGATAPAEVRVGSFKVDAADNAYVLDVTTPRVLVLDPSGSVTRQVALPAGALFSDVAVDGAGTIYALDSKEAALWVADAAATAFKRLTPSLEAYMSFPTYLAIERALLLVVDQNGGGVVQIGVDGSYQGRALAFGTSEGLVSYPSQLCVTSAGETFVADRSNNRVQLFARPE
jgi:hypothetical protein